MKKLYLKIAKTDDEQRMVYGYASTEALDSAGEVIAREAIAKALPDYMRFANVREMHTASAVGVAHEATMDEQGLYIAAHIVDDLAWRKVQTGVYKGFSIGGSVTKRDPADRSRITGLKLTEISLCDRPANPETVFDLYKADEPQDEPEGSDTDADAPPEPAQSIHDHAVSMGARCPVAKTEGGRERLALGEKAALASLQGAVARSAERLAKAEANLAEMATERDTLARRLKALEAQPLPPRAPLAAVSKEADAVRVGPPSDEGELDALALIKRAQMNPLRMF